MNNSPETDALRKDLEQLRQDFASLTKDVKKTSKDEAQAGMHKARESMSSLCSEVESRPYISIVTALGIGLILGKLFSR